MNDTEFQEKLKEWASYGEEDGAELAHIRPRELKLLFAAILWDPEGVLSGGEYLLAKALDPLAVLEAMHAAAESLVEDAEEHEPSDKSRLQELKDQVQALMDRIEALRKKGGKSSVYKIWKTKYGKKYDTLADEIASGEEDL